MIGVGAHKVEKCNLSAFKADINSYLEIRNDSKVIGMKVVAVEICCYVVRKYQVHSHSIVHQSVQFTYDTCSLLNGSWIRAREIADAR